MQKKGFSFIEIIIVVTIIALLAVIGVSLNSQYQEKTMNAKISSDLDTLKGSLSLYKADTSTLPLPLGNINFYGKSAEYMHSWSGAYGVYGSIRENILPKKYINTLPVDPRTNQYYAYGETFGTGEFEIAGVVSQDGKYESLVVGNYLGKEGPQNLIREYNGTNFVFNGSQDIFPYNPEKKAMNAKILSNSGAVSVNGQIVSDINIPVTILVSGDSVSVGTGSSVQIGFSDGSISTLGDANTNSEIVLAYLDYKSDSFFTKISIALKIGTLWSQATKLDTESEFQIYTSDTTASVRGTVFGISKNSLGSNRITVNAGKVAIAKILNSVSGNNFDSLVSRLSQNLTIEKNTLDVPGITTRGYEGNIPVSYIEVLEGHIPLSVELKPDGGTTSEGVIQPLEDKTFSDGISLEVQYVGRTPIDGRLNSIYIKKDYRFKSTDKIIQNNEDYQNGYTLSSITYPYYPSINLSSEKLKTPNGISTFSVKVCRTASLCTQTLTLPMVELQKVTEGESDVCDGVKIENHCIKNELSASGYTLVGVADYTRRDGTLYTFNGGKINGGYTGSALINDDGYKPINVTTSTGGIRYDLSKLIDEKEFVIEVMLKGDGFSSVGIPYLLYQDYTLSNVFYLGSVRKLGFLGITESLNGNISNSDIYKIQVSSHKEKKTLKLLDKDNNVLFSKSISSSTIKFNPFSNLYIGKKDYGPTNNWIGSIRGIKLYKPVTQPTLRAINNLNQINLRR